MLNAADCAPYGLGTWGTVPLCNVFLTFSSAGPYQHVYGNKTAEGLG